LIVGLNMKYWTRTTHNFNNETREWEFKGDYGDATQQAHFTGKSTLGIHALISGRWQSLHEITSENQEYYKQHKDDPYSGCHESGHLEEAVLHDLEEMEKLGWVKSKER
jgi:hypothetical protein